MAKLKTWLALGWRDRLAFVRAWGRLCLAKAALGTIGLRRTLAILGGTPSGSAGAAPASLPRADIRWIPIAARYVPGGATCLVRSVALAGLLRRRGIRAELRIGVGEMRPALEAHAWVEVDGVPVNESVETAGRYRAFGASPVL